LGAQQKGASRIVKKGEFVLAKTDLIAVSRGGVKAVNKTAHLHHEKGEERMR